LVRFLARELAQEAVGIDLRTDLVHEHLHSERDGSERTAPRRRTLSTWTSSRTATLMPW
jgi:hypothetical protein